jgi:putative transposase
MKRKRFSEEQIIAVLREHDAGFKAADLARKYGVSEATLYNKRAGCESWPMNDGASATGACSSCYAGRASHQGSTGSTGSIATRG